MNMTHPTSISTQTSDEKERFLMTVILDTRVDEGATESWSPRVLSGMSDGVMSDYTCGAVVTLEVQLQPKWIINSQDGRCGVLKWTWTLKKYSPPQKAFKTLCRRGLSCVCCCQCSRWINTKHSTFQNKTQVLHANIRQEDCTKVLRWKLMFPPSP